mgnify:CR=1 FL=1
MYAIIKTGGKQYRVSVGDKLKVAICSDGFEFTGLTGAGAPLTWDAEGAVSKDPAAVIIENGAYKAL